MEDLRKVILIVDDIELNRAILKETILSELLCGGSGERFAGFGGNSKIW